MPSIIQMVDSVFYSIVLVFWCYFLLLVASLLIVAPLVFLALLSPVPTLLALVIILQCALSG